MKTNIKIKDLLKLINPMVDGINYKGHNIKVDLNILKEYILNPKSKNILQSSDNSEDNLYKNLALYIINTSGDYLISLDLDKNAIINGIFEYVKAIYNNQTNVHIELPEIGDNALLIKTKKLTKINIDIENAIDVEYSGLSSIFSKTTQFDIDKNHIKGKFFWKENETNIFDDKNWLITQIKKNISNIENKNRHNNINENIFSQEIQTLFEKVESILLTDELKIEFLELNSKHFNEYMIKHSDTFNLDFNKPIFHDFLDKEIKNNNFELLKLIFEKSDHNINYNYFFNQQNVIEYLLAQYYSYSNKKSLNIVTAYDYFNYENKTNNTIVLGYLDKIKDSGMSSRAYYPEGLFYKIPLEVFKDEQMLTNIFSKISLENFSSKIKNYGIDIPLFKSKNFIINHIQKLDNQDINFLLKNCLHPDEIDKDFIKKLLSLKPALFNSFINIDNPYSNLVRNNIDVIMAAGKVGDNIGYNHINLLLNHFLVDGTREEEEFKLNVIIKNNIDINNRAKYYYINPEDRIKFKTKYLKLEYLFFKVDKYSYIDTNSRNKALAKIKKPEDIQQLIEKIHSFNIEATIDYQAIYKNLNPILKINVPLLENTGLLDKIEFTDLPEALHYNKKIALKFIAKYPNDIPVEFFNDSTFCLEYAKNLDEMKVSIDKSPKFIIKFFENQGIKKDFYQYLKSYIEMSTLNITLNEENNKSIKKLKI